MTAQPADPHSADQMRQWRVTRMCQDKQAAEQAEPLVIGGEAPETRPETLAEETRDPLDAARGIVFGLGVTLAALVIVAAAVVVVAELMGPRW